MSNICDALMRASMTPIIARTFFFAPAASLEHISGNVLTQTPLGVAPPFFLNVFPKETCYTGSPGG